MVRVRVRIRECQQQPNERRVQSGVRIRNVLPGHYVNWRLPAEVCVTLGYAKTVRATEEEEEEDA